MTSSSHSSTSRRQTRNGPASSPPHLFPAASEFDDLLKKERWDRLIWLPYDAEHAPELMQVLNALNEWKTLRNILGNWIKSAEKFDESGTKSRVDVVERFVQFLDIVYLKMLPRRELAARGLTIALKTTFDKLQTTLIDNEFREELEMFRDKLCDRLRLQNNPTAEQLSFTSKFWSDMCYTGSSRYRTFSHLTNMFCKDEGTRARFLKRCKDECETLLVLAEAVGVNREGMTDSSIIDSLSAIATILAASRLSAALDAPTAIGTPPLPAEIASDVQDYMKRMFRLCLDSGYFADLKTVLKALTDTLDCLPDFWISCHCLPACKLVEFTWDTLVIAENGAGEIEFDALRYISEAFRSIAYVLTQNHLILDRVENWLASKVDPTVLEEALAGTPAAALKPEYPHLALLISKVMHVFTKPDPLSVSSPKSEMYIWHMCTLQDIILLAELPSSIPIMRRAMKMSDFAALRGLENRLAVIIILITGIYEQLKGEHYELACAHLRLLPIELQAVLNTLETVLHIDIHVFFWPEPTFAKMMVKALAAAQFCEKMRTSDENLEPRPPALDPRLTLYTSVSCALCILNAYLAREPSKTVPIDDALRVLFQIGIEKAQPGQNEAVLALLALARLVKDSPEDWRKLQEYGSNLGVGMSLSDICVHICSETLQDYQGVRWMAEVLSVFQYMAEEGDDDGNNESPGLTTENNATPKRAIGLCVDAFVSYVRFDPCVMDNHEMVESIFELVANFAANAAKYERVTSKKNEKQYIEPCRGLLKQLLNIFSTHLHRERGVHWRNMQVTEACMFAIANVAALPDREIKLLSLPLAREMAALTFYLHDWRDDFYMSEGEREWLDELFVMTCRAIINTSAVLPVDETENDLLDVCISGLRRRSVAVSVHALLALHNLVRNRPERKAALYNSEGGRDRARSYDESEDETRATDETEEDTSAEGILVACFERASKSQDSAFLDCIQVFLKEFMTNNPRMVTEESQARLKGLNMTKPTRSLREAAIALGVPLT